MSRLRQVPLHPRDALLLEGLVADGEDLVGDQDVGRERRRHRKAEPDDHPRRVVLDRLVDVLADVGEGDDRVALRRDLRGGQIPAARRQGRCSPAPCIRDGSPIRARGARRRGRGRDPAARRADHAGDDLEQRRFSRAVLADHAQRLAARSSRLTPSRARNACAAGRPRRRSATSRRRPPRASAFA